MQTITSYKQYNGMKWTLGVVMLSVLVIFSSCRDDSFYSGEVMFNFSEDTLRFDTVFTELGSATRFVKLFNPHPDRVKIESMFLASGEQSFFRMNVDGASGKSLTNIEIAPNDSLYIFVEVTIDPDNPLSLSPFVIEDQIIINSDQDQQLVYLEAFGQNANYLPEINAAGAITFPPCNNGTIVWDDPKPYVVYGLYVIQDCTLEIAPGTRVYVHGGVVSDPDLGVYNDGLILFGENGRLIANGTPEDTIVFQGDRLESSFQDDAGQWQGLRFLTNSQGSELSNVTIKNSIFGIQLDSTAQAKVSQTKIFNTSAHGVIAVHADLQMENTLVHSNGGHAVICVYGGNYDFDYCTFASYGTDQAAMRLNNYICRDDFCFEREQNPLNIRMDNSLIVGSLQDEFFLEDDASGDPSFYDYQFRNCIVRVDSLLDNARFGDFFNQCDNCINLNIADNDTLFVDLDNQDYHLDTFSLAEGRAVPLPGIEIDLDNQFRDVLTPDIGCYEFQE